ncbi:MAG: chromosome segregation SMC family protein [Candidatus Nanohaloarchaea archaeon]|nr:chromosome segregation SMC family protein [Candidatus Nanohaloarchaea archaeon]
MTKINKLTMEGFKSFQRKTAVPFYDGLTAIVGTNGSGKSNIQEAIQFVMGRRSSKLRAEKMEQLIFNGGEDRKPSEKAEVTLYLENEGGKFDELLEEGEGSDEIKIGRRIKRNGYSTYTFQGNNCKRKKIDRILDAAGIDREGYHIIQQGRITQIVKQTPVERRKAIDRISGIAAYDSKVEDAEEELEEAQAELNELEIKLDLKRDRLERLKEEKEDAERYQELEHRKNVLKASVLEKRKEEIEEDLEGLSEEDGDDIEELEDGVEELDEKIEELEDRLEEIEEEMEEMRDESLVRDIENLKGKIERKKDKIENKRDKIEDIEEMLEDYESMQKSRAGSSRAVNEVLGLDKQGVYGTVADLIHYNERFAVAIETAAGKRMENIVVEAQDVAVECVNHLKRNDVGRATFLPLDKVSPRRMSNAAEEALKLPGVIDYAINLVDYDREYEDAIKQVFGDTLVAEDIESLEDAGKVRAVTLDGDIMRKSGAITGGAKKKRRKKKRKKPNFNPEDKREEKRELEEDIEELKREIGEMNELLEEKKKEEEEESEVSEELKGEKKDLREELDELKEERREKAEELKRLRNEIGKDQKKRAKLEAELENVEADLEELEDSMKSEDSTRSSGTGGSTSVEEREEGSLKSLKTKKTKTINEMNDLGNVNLRAIDEYEEFKEEFDEFKEKVEELRQEKREIEQIIDDIEEKKTEEFMDTLEQVNGSFQDIFSKLFEGGEAELELEEEGNIDSGLEIRAQPPDKDPHVIDSLSGGEKSLTAVAFMFALQEYDPAPFYVLDEIDAALDKKNSKRLSDLLRDYADDHQFIVISHNNETVRHADRAYGVSMQEGVSQVRSIDLEEL